MQNPKLIPVPFANNGMKDDIPKVKSPAMSDEKASWESGFPEATMLPVYAGGLPPDGKDFNGVLNQISENIVFQSKGGRYKFDPDFALSIGGYPKGATLQTNDESAEYQSLIDNNLVNFNTATPEEIAQAWRITGIGDATEVLNKKFDKTSVRNELGLSQTEVVSQKVVTELGSGVVGSFENGLNFIGELTNRDQLVTLENEFGKQMYCWSGEFPKQVPADSTPQSTGGIGKGAWVSVGDASLRGDLKKEDGAALINAGNISLYDSNVLYAEQFGDLTVDDATLTMQLAIDYAALTGRALHTKTPVINVKSLKLPSNLTLNITQSVIKRTNVSNQHLIENKNASFSKGIFGDKNITIIGGNFDGNGLHQANTTSNGEALQNILFVGVDGLRFIDGVKSAKSRRYNFHIINCTNVYVNGGVYIDNDPTIPSSNKDGFHIAGNCSNFYIDKVVANNPEDDALAINADDVDHGGRLSVANITGTIDNINVGNVHLTGEHSRNGVRILSARNGTAISNINIGDITGQCSVYALNISDYGLGAGSIYKNIKIGNIQCEFLVRPYANAKKGLVDIDTYNSKNEFIHPITIGNISRTQTPGDGEDRPTVGLSLANTNLKIGSITETYCNNPESVRSTRIGRFVKIDIDGFMLKASRNSDRVLVSLWGGTGAIIDQLSTGYQLADKISKVLVVRSCSINALCFTHDYPLNIPPIILENSTIKFMRFNSSVKKTIMERIDRYSIDNSTIEIERPPALVSNTANLPTNALQGDEIYNWETKKKMLFNGTEWLNLH
ncbi:hypothetical protein [Providencia sneebia]|uniref:Tail fiber protein n=1 Tax=Providencia sneebia DSM 19967 TaxID=1141660 RepID=K8WJS0_9GAMM|nr:tail fiber protein [Providencia sneebia DSM 19967]